MKCFIDAIVGLPSFPSTETKQVMQNQSSFAKAVWSSQRRGCPFRIDLALRPQHSGKITIVKIINLKDKKNAVDQFAIFVMVYFMLWVGRVL